MPKSMLDKKQAAEYFIVGWCKDWSVMDYLRFVGVPMPAPNHIIEGKEWDAIEQLVSSNFPWMPKHARQYSTKIKTFVGCSYPKLSTWLFDRNSDVERLKCASQIEKLRSPERIKKVSDQDRIEMKASSRDEKQASASYRLSRAAFQTNQRSAWNVCKA